MSNLTQPPWLRGPLPSVIAPLQPVAHSLIDAEEDVRKVVPYLSDAEIADRPSGAAPIAYHVIHAIGSLDRLLTYARGESLDEAQKRQLSNERTFDPTLYSAQALVESFAGAIDKALAQLAATPEGVLLEPRLVGRARLPSNTLGLLFHAAEHTARHVGQIVTTAMIVKGARAEPKS